MYIEILGWVATALISTSFFVKSLDSLKWIQLFSSILWATYGVLIKSNPVIVANILVFLSIITSFLIDKRKVYDVHKDELS